jgi:hypothetical protein
LFFTWNDNTANADSTNNKCSLFNGACFTDGSSVTDTTMYSNSDFFEEPLVTADKCTHYRVWANNAAEVAACKSRHADKATCENAEFCYTLAHENESCDQLASTNLLFSGTTNDDYTLATCAKACKEDGGVSFKYGTQSDTAQGQCYCYNAACDASGTDASEFDVYNVDCHCYWTALTTVYAQSGCENSADVSPDTTSYTADWTAQRCHRQC